MNKFEQTEKKKGSISNRMNDFYFELKTPGGEVKIFEKGKKSIEEKDLQK